MAQCTAAACFSLETEAGFHSASSSYTVIIITKQQNFSDSWIFTNPPSNELTPTFQSCSDSALLSNICLKRGKPLSDVVVDSSDHTQISSAG